MNSLLVTQFGVQEVLFSLESGDRASKLAGAVTVVEFTRHQRGPRGLEPYTKQLIAISEVGICLIQPYCRLRGPVIGSGYEQRSSLIQLLPRPSVCGRP